MSDPRYYDTIDAACANLAEMAGGVIAHATVMQSYAEMRFYPGLDFASRCTVAYLRAMTAAHDELVRARAFKKLSEDIGPGQGI